MQFDAKMKMMNRIKRRFVNWKRWIGGAVTIVVFVLPILVYFLNFHSGFSNDHSDWSAFGDYIGGVYSVIVAILLFYLTINANFSAEKRNEKKEALIEIYEYIVDVSEDDAGLEHNKVLRKLAVKKRLYISEEVYNKVIQFADYYIELNGDRTRRDPNRINEILNELKCSIDKL